MIELNNISKTFDNKDSLGSITALQSVSLIIESGKTVSIIGPSGCGKSTLLEIIAGLQLPTGGSIRINGKIVNKSILSTDTTIRKRYCFLSFQSNSFFHNTRKKDIAMVFQDCAVFPWMNVLENIIFALQVSGVPRGERKNIASELLKKVNLDRFANAFPGQLSGGMTQKVAIARAMALKPKILLLDEPFASVDSITRRSLQDFFVSMNVQRALTTLLVTHDIEEALYLSDEIVVLSSQPGTIKKHIKIDIARPRDRYSQVITSLKKELIMLLE